MWVSLVVTVLMANFGAPVPAKSVDGECHLHGQPYWSQSLLGLWPHTTRSLVSGWWFQRFLFSPLFVEDSHFDIF